MSPQARGLGRGLGALIPSAEANPPSAYDSPGVMSGGGLLSVPIAELSPNPHQPRNHITSAELEELAASIREHGIIQPLIVTRAPAGSPASYQLIAGERRWRAAQLAGLAEVPVVVKEATPQQLLELALIENIQRADLNPLEEAAAYQSLISEFGLTQNAVAGRVGRSRVAVANMLRLLRLPEPIKARLADRTLSEGHARALLGLADDEPAMLRLAVQVAERGLTVRQTEELVRRLLAQAAEAQDEAQEVAEDEPQSTQTRQLEEHFRSALGTKVSLTRGRRGGRLVIHFYSDEELHNIYEQIVGQS